MKYILILILQNYDAGGMATAEFNDLESCLKAKEWSTQQIINRQHAGNHYSAVRAECFAVQKGGR